MDAKATDSFRDRNLSANYSCGLLRLRLESDWSQNNKHSRNNLGVHGLMAFTVTLLIHSFVQPCHTQKRGVISAHIVERNLADQRN